MRKLLLSIVIISSYLIGASDSETITLPQRGPATLQTLVARVLAQRYGSETFLSELYEDCDVSSAAISENISPAVQELIAKELLKPYKNRIVPPELYSTKHDVCSFAYHPKGINGALGTVNAIILIYDESGNEIKQLEGHANSINAVAYNPNGTQLASGSLDGIRLWDTTDWKQLTYLPDQNSNIYKLQYNPYCVDQLVSMRSGDEGIDVWDLQRKERVTTLAGKCLAFNQTKAQCAVVQESANVAIYDAKTWEGMGGVHYSRYISSVTYHPLKDQLMVRFDTSVIGLSRNEDYRILDLLKLSAVSPNVAYDSKGKKLIAASYGELSLWDTKTWQQCTQLEVEEQIKNATLAAFHPNNKQFRVLFVDYKPDIHNFHYVTKTWNIPSYKKRIEPLNLAQAMYLFGELSNKVKHGICDNQKIGLLHESLPNNIKQLIDLTKKES